MAAKKGGFAIFIGPQMVRLDRPANCDCRTLLAEIARQCNEELDIIKPIKIKHYNVFYLKFKSMSMTPVQAEIASIAGDCVEAAGYRIIGFASDHSNVTVYCSSKV
tara:strand:- start:84 stop:401 length:318 start_codon:yes stop_codon:yes gene_type:complete